MSSPFERNSGKIVSNNESAISEDMIVQDAPTMRSVAVMSSGPSLLDGPFQPKSMGISYPAGGFGEKSPALKPLGPPSLKLPSPARLGFAKPTKSTSMGIDMNKLQVEWTGVTSASVWDVKDDALELVPFDFPLERTHREITELASTVSRRISETLATLSIEAEYDSEKAKAKCKTCDFVGFRIRLFSGDISGQPVIVEIQRRCGSPSSFMKSCRAILNAAEGRMMQEKKSMPPFMKKPINQMKCLARVPNEGPSPTESARDALSNVVGMMRSRQVDSNVFGLENLCSLTDPMKTTPAVAVVVSKSIVLGDEEFDVREEIQLLTERDVFTGFGPEEVGSENRPEHFRQLALTVFANALSVCRDNGCLEGAVAEQKWFMDPFIPSLVDEVKRASSNACNAYFATSCLHSLAVSSRAACECMVANDAKLALKESCDFGNTHHELLANESRRCLEKLEGI